MILVRCDATTRRIETTITASDYRSNRRYKLDHLPEQDWDHIVDLLTMVEQANYVLSTYKDFLYYIKSQMVGKIMDATAYFIFAGLINDMVMISDDQIVVTG